MRMYVDATLYTTINTTSAPSMNALHAQERLLILLELATAPKLQHHQPNTNKRRPKSRLQSTTALPQTRHAQQTNLANQIRVGVGYGN